MGPWLISYRQIYPNLESICDVVIPCQFDNLYLGNMSFEARRQFKKNIAVTEKLLKQEDSTIDERIDVIQDIIVMEKL